MPLVEFPAAEPAVEAALAAAADPLVSQAYVYLFLVEEPLPVELRANIPFVLFPAADPL